MHCLTGFGLPPVIRRALWSTRLQVRQVQVGEVASGRITSQEIYGGAGGGLAVSEIGKDKLGQIGLRSRKN